MKLHSTRRSAIIGFDVDGDQMYFRTRSCRSNRRTVAISDDWLEVNCWCERSVVYVPAPELVAGFTRHCRRPDCVKTGRKAAGSSMEGELALYPLKSQGHASIPNRELRQQQETARRERREQQEREFNEWWRNQPRTVASALETARRLRAQ